MAKGQKIGGLYYDIDGDEKKLMDKFQKLKSEAVSIETIFKNIKMDIGGNKISPDIQKAQIAADKLAISRDKVTKAAMDAIKAEELANKAIADSNNAKKQGLILEQKRATEAGITAKEVNRASQIELDTIIKQEAAKRKALMDEEKLSGMRKRNAMIGVQGQKDMAAAYGLTNKTMFSQKNLLQQLSSAAGIYFSVYQAGAFLKELAMVSGEFEKQRLSLRAIIQDSQAADKIFNQIKNLAVSSPFNFKELTDYAKQLSAFSVPTNEIFDTMNRLADISAGLGVDMNRIILAYGQVRSASVLRGQELRQFTEAGIPLVDELAKKFGELSGKVVTAREVFDNISNRKVPFAMIKDIFTEMTSEGGKFYNMQEIQAASLAGKISNLRDAYDIMLDSIGSANSEMLKGGVQSLVDIMDNWKSFWNILKTIIASYGVYRATLAAVNVIEKANIAVKRAAVTQMQLMTSQGIALSKSQAVASAQTQVLTTKLNALKGASAFNPAGIALAGITALIGVVATYISHQNQLKEKIFETVNALNEQRKSVNNYLDRLKELSSASKDDKDAQTERIKTLNKLKDVEPEVAKSIKDHADSLENLIEVQKRYNSIINFEKFTVYAANDSNGFFSDNLLESLEKLATAQNEADMSSSRLVRGYNKIEEALSRWNTESKDVTGGMKVLSDTTISELNKIISSSDSVTDKILAIRKLTFSSSGKDRASLFRLAGLIDESDFKNFIDSSRELSSATDDANSKISDFTENIKGYLKSNNLDIKENEDNIRELIKSWEELGDFGQKAILLNLGIKWEGEEGEGESLDGWVKDLSEALGGIINISAESNIADILSDVQKSYKEGKDFIESKDPILLKWGFSYETGDYDKDADIPSVIKAQLEAASARVKAHNDLVNAANKVGISLTDKDKPKNDKDSFTEKLKEQLDLIKQAKSEYDKLKKHMSESDAAENITSQKVYSGVDVYTLTDDGYLSHLESQLKKLEKRNTESAKKTRQSIEKEIATINLNSISESAKKEFDKIEKYLSQYKDKYSLYETLFETTGDKTLSMKIVFGDVAGVVESYRDKLKAELDKTDDPELKEKLQKQLTDIDFEENTKITKTLSDVLKEYKTFKDKKREIDAKYEGELTLLEGLKPSDEIQEKIDLLKQSWASALSELEEGSLKLNPIFMKLFGDIGSYGTRTLNNIIAKTKQIIETAKKNTDGSYSIDIEGESKNISEDFYLKLIKNTSKAEKEVAKRNPFTALTKSIKDYKDAEDKDGKSDAMERISESLTEIGGIASSVGSSLSGMFDALGNESMADTVGLIGELSSSLADVGAGIASGNYVQAAQGIISSITSIANFHDKKLDKAIRKSQIVVKKLSNEYANLQRTVERQLGSITNAQADKLYKNQENQIAELEKQLAAERKKKKRDKGAIADLEAQIDEAKDKLRYFYEDLAGEQWGIGIKDWAGQITDAIVDAFASGEDAAAAFDSTVADIMKNVVKNMIQMSVIEPAMNRLRTQLFGSDGKGGLLGKGTAELSKSDAIQIGTELSKLKDKISEGKDIWDYLNGVLKEQGINMEEQADKDSLSKGIQNVTEDTANLLASYLNAIRGDVSLQKIYFSTLIQLSQTNSETFANMYAELQRIQLNTAATASNTGQNVQLVTEIKNILTQATIKNSGVGFNV